MLNAKKIIEILKKLKDVELAHYASSLSFHTILALIPMLLITFGIFTKMPIFEVYYDKLQGFIFNALIPTQQDVMVGYLRTFMTNTDNMGVVGIIFVLYISVMFFLDYEKIVSKIFNAPVRSFWEALTTYWSLVTLMPLGLIIFFYTSTTAQSLLDASNVSSLISLMSLSPYLVVWLLFLVMYFVSAKTKIHLKSALIASFVGSSVWYLSKILFVYYVSYNKTYLSIYGSFSILLFFFLWIYFSWYIYLYGLKLCFLLNEEETQNAKS